MEGASNIDFQVRTESQFCLSRFHEWCFFLVLVVPQAVCGIASTVVVVILFVVFSTSFRKIVESIVVKPVNRMMRILRVSCEIAFALTVRLWYSLFLSWVNCGVFP